MKQIAFLLLVLSCALGCTTKIQPKPVADFDYTPVASKPGSFQFNNKSSNADRYQWVFSDGQATTDENPVITFKSNGTYTATLTAKTSNNVDEVTKSIEITGVTPAKPVADFDMTRVNGVPGQVQFTNKSTNAERYQWIFSDGQASTEASPLITFKSNGTYTAKLTAKSATGSDEASKTVEISGIVTTGNIFFWTNNGGNGDIEVYVENSLRGLITQAQSTAPACGADGSVTLTYPAGTYSYYAKSKTRSWSGSFTVKNGECTSKLLQ